MSKEYYAKTAKVPKSNVFVFSNRQTAERFARNSKQHIILGDNDDYVVTTPAAASKLRREGYQYA